MEATSRPMLEPLTDLPVEEPPEGAPTPRPGRNTSTPGEAAARAMETPKPRPGEATTGDELIDPEELLGASEPLSMASERDTPGPPCRAQRPWRAARRPPEALQGRSAHRQS